MGPIDWRLAVLFARSGERVGRMCVDSRRRSGLCPREERFGVPCGGWRGHRQAFVAGDGGIYCAAQSQECCLTSTKRTLVCQPETPQMRAFRAPTSSATTKTDCAGTTLLYQLRSEPQSARDTVRIVLPEWRAQWPMARTMRPERRKRALTGTGTCTPLSVQPQPATIRDLVFTLASRQDEAMTDDAQTITIRRDPPFSAAQRANRVAGRGRRPFGHRRSTHGRRHSIESGPSSSKMRAFRGSTRSLTRAPTVFGCANLGSRNGTFRRRGFR